MWLNIGEMNSNILGVGRASVRTASEANDTINAVDKALDKLLENRSNIGAQQNRFEHAMANENNIRENTTSAESAIRDTDIDKEIVENAQKNILSEVTQAMMAQNNQNRQSVLTLIK